MAEAGAVFALFVLVGLLAPLGLYALVRADHDQREEMSREAAERAARRDADDER